MSSLSLPQLATQTVRTSSWEPDFEKNLGPFTEILAGSIAQEALEKLNLAISNPYRTLVDEKNKFTFTVSLIITNTSDAKKIMTLAADSEPVPPFHGWLHTFSVENKTPPLKTDAEEHDEEQLETFSVARHDPSFENDKNYFAQKMEVVTWEVAQQLQNILAEYSSLPGHRDLEFEVTSFHSSASPCGGALPGGGSLNHLTIAFWFQNKHISQQIETSTGRLAEAKAAVRAIRYHSYARTSITLIAILIVAGAALMIFSAIETKNL